MVVWIIGSLIQRDEIVFPEGFCDLGRIILVEVFHDLEGPCPFFSYNLAFALQLRKNMENYSQG
jgi:hypothetical protein